MPHSITLHRRALGVLAATLSAAMLAVILVPGGAAAADQPMNVSPGSSIVTSEPGTIELVTEPPASYHQWSFGGVDNRLPLGLDTRTLVIDLDLPVVYNNVECWGNGPGETSFFRTWTEEEWLADPTMSVADYSRDVGQYTVVTCRSGNEEYYDGFYIEWILQTVSVAGESVTLSDDPAYAYGRSTANYVNTPDPAVVAGTPGDAVRLVGPEGTFFPDGRLKVAFGLGNIAVGIMDYYMFSEDAAISTDGSTVTFTLPTDVPPEFYEEPMYTSLSNTSPSGTLPGGGYESTSTIWYGGFGLTRPDEPQQVASSARLGLSLNTALSFQRVRATVVVTVPETFSPAGEATFFVDGVAVGTAQITRHTHNRASLVLPKLERGRHSITVEYSGNTLVAPSTSPPASLRILL